MPFFDTIRIGASGAVADFTVDRSLRFNSADATMLQRTLSSSGNRRTFTWSGWVKRSKPDSSSGEALFSSTTEVSSGNSNTYLTFYQDKIYINSYNYPSTAYTLTTTQVFRDPSAWYHIVWAVDTTQSTSSDRIKLYINGEQVTSFSTETYPSQNYEGLINSSSYKMTMGRAFPSLTNNSPVNGYMAEINFIDGLQLTPSSFGETNSDTGQWVPIDTSGLTFGTNGFRLQFDDNSGTSATTLGKDASGNGNNFTPNNFSVSAGAGNDSVTDTPTNNFCTYNPLDSHSNITLSNGNLTASISSGFKLQRSTFFLSSGKWYWEVTCDDVFPAGFLGITDSTDSTNSQGGASSSSCMIRTNNGDKRIGGSESSYGSGISDGDVMIFALDMDNGKFWAGKNGTFFNSGNPATGSNAATSNVTNPVTPSLGMYDNEDYTANFGQVKMDSTSYADANGHGAFKYSVPSGYFALCSANLSDPTILLPNEHFNTVLYSGDGNSTRSISGVGFKPDWLWLKGRNTGYSHLLYNSVVGAGSGKGLNSNESRAEGSAVGDNSTYGFLNSFDSDGFSVTKGSDSTSYTNGGSSTYVAWNWNAGDTDGKTYAVTVVSDSGNKYRFDGFGTSAVTLDLAEGGTYVFDWSDSSAQSHPIRFSTTSDGTHGGGSEYTTGVTKDDSAYKTTITVAASAPTLYYYCQNHSGMGGQVNTNSTLGSSNFDGDLQSTTKVNATAGFSIVKWTSGGNLYKTVGHGLGVKPDIVILKSRTTINNWFVYFDVVDGTNDFMELSATNAALSAETYSIVPPTSTVFGTDGAFVSGSSNIPHIGYVFSSVSGYSKVGKYTGNGSSDGPFVFTGFRPAWVLVKNTSTAYSWDLNDNKRDPDNVCEKVLSANLADSEATATSMDFLSNGFKLRVNNNSQNRNGDTFIYLAFAESPFKNARAR